MASNDYHFVTHWRIKGAVKEITDILSDGSGLARWWPSVYLDVKELAPGDARGIGRRIALYTKGWLPYTLRWQFVITEISDIGFTLEATGDFNGKGVWTFAQNGDYVDVIYDWMIRADKPLLRDYSLVMKPIFSANHHWAMHKGEESLKLELARRRVTTPEERALIPAPPPATTSSPLPLMLAAGVIVLVALLVIQSFFGTRKR